jgi:DNA-binding MarR family transcriptional regulator
MTPKQRQYLSFIDTYYRDNGWSPCYREIADAMGVSINTVGKMLRTLETAGYVWREPGVQRNVRVRVLKLAESSAPTKQTKTSRYLGVSRHRNRWQARICITHGVTEHIGSYRTELEAARAYDAHVLARGLDKPLNFEGRKSA